MKGPPSNRNSQQDQATEGENKTTITNTNLGMKGSEGKLQKPTELTTKQLRPSPHWGRHGRPDRWPGSPGR